MVICVVRGDAGSASGAPPGQGRGAPKKDDRSFAQSAENVAERLRETFPERVPLRCDRELADALALEARPVAEALLEGLAGTASADPHSGELREAIAMASLLGRRAADLGATPSGTLTLIATLTELASREDPRALEVLDSLREVAIEGYVAAREERMEREAAQRTADAIAILEPVSGCLVIALAGQQDADELERVLEEAGRRLLERNAKACVVDTGQLRQADADRARQVFAFDATCRMLGVACIFASVAPEWRRAARDAGFDTDALRLAPDFATGVAMALEACGLELRSRDRLGAVLRRIAPRRAR